MIIFGIFGVGTGPGHGGIYEPATMMSAPGAQHVAQARVEPDWQCGPDEGAACAD